MTKHIQQMRLDAFVEGLKNGEIKYVPKKTDDSKMDWSKYYRALPRIRAPKKIKIPNSHTEPLYP